MANQNQNQNDRNRQGQQQGGQGGFAPGHGDHPAHPFFGLAGGCGLRA